MHGSKAVTACPACVEAVRVTRRLRLLVRHSDGFTRRMIAMLLERFDATSHLTDCPNWSTP